MWYMLMFSILIMLAGCGEDQHILRGYVKDAQTQEPLSGVAIILDNNLSATTDANGLYIFEEMPSGTVKLTAARSGYQVWTAEIKIKDDENYGIALKKVDNQPPVIQNVRIETVDAMTVRIRWVTDEPATSILEYGGAANRYSESVASKGQGTEHEVLLTNLFPDAAYHYRVQATDALGNGPLSLPYDENPTMDAKFTTSIGKSRPDVTLIGAPEEFTNRRQITFRWDGYDDISPPEDLVYSYYLSGIDTGYGTFSFSREKTYTDLQDGSYTFYVRVRDAQGNEDDTPATFAFVVDTAPPANVGIIINNGDSQTSSRSVELQLRAAGASDVWISDVPGFTYTGWEPFTPIRQWELSEGDGNKTIWARFRDPAGNISPTVSDSITLGTAPPEPVTGAPAVPVISSPSHPSGVWSNKRGAVLQWRSDSSGIAGYAYSLDQKPDTIPDKLFDQQTSASFKDVSDGVWYFHLSAKGESGLWSDTAHYKVLVDATPPQLTITYPADGSNYQTAVLEYRGEASDASSGVDTKGFAYQIGSGKWQSFTNDAQLPNWKDRDEIPHPDTGDQSLSIRIRDLAGNETIAATRFGFTSEPLQTSVFAIGGAVYRADGKKTAPNGLIVRILNINTGKSADGTTGGNSGEGRYTVTFLDFNSNRAAKTGDKLEISVWNGDKQVAGVNYTISRDDILAGHALVNITTDIQ